MHLLNHSMLKSNSLERISGELLTRSFSYSALRTYMHIPTKNLLTPYEAVLETLVAQKRTRQMPHPKCFHNGIVLIVICFKLVTQR